MEPPDIRGEEDVIEPSKIPDRNKRRQFKLPLTYGSSSVLVPPPQGPAQDCWSFNQIQANKANFHNFMVKINTFLG
jgi:hypothetical protein